MDITEIKSEKLRRVITALGEEYKAETKHGDMCAHSVLAGGFEIEVTGLVRKGRIGKRTCSFVFLYYQGQQVALVMDIGPMDQLKRVVDSLTENRYLLVDRPFSGSADEFLGGLA